MVDKSSLETKLYFKYKHIQCDVAFIVIVKCLHVCMLHTIGPPVFRTPLAPVSVPIGEVATFRCDVYSNPIQQSVSWMFSGITIVSDGLRITATNTLLTINSVQREDKGSYSCVVTNEYGSQQSSATLSIGTIIVPSLYACV